MEAKPHNEEERSKACGSSGPVRETIWSAAFVILMAANFFQSMAAFTTNVTIPLYLDHLGAAAGSIGVVVGAFGITALAARPFAGPAFDSFSRKKLLMIAQGVIVVAFFLYGLADTVEQVFAVRLLHGLGMGGTGPLALSLVSDHLPAKKLASGVSIYALAQSFAQVIGPATGLWLVNTVGYSCTYFIAAACLAVSVVAISRIREEPKQRMPYTLKFSRMFAREAVSMALVLTLFSIAFAATTSYLVLYANKLGVEGIGLYFTVYALCLLVTRPLFGKLADRFTAQRVLLPGVGCFAVSYIMLANTTTLAGFLAVAVVAAAGFGSCLPLVQSLAMASVPQERRGSASNTIYTGLDLGNLIGPATAGATIELLQPLCGSLTGAYSAMWYVMLVPLAFALAVIIWWNVKSK